MTNGTTRPVDQTCGNCRYWDNGICRRYPPYMQARADQRPGHMTVWTATNADDWCGEYKSPGDVK